MRTCRAVHIASSRCPLLSLPRAANAPALLGRRSLSSSLIAPAASSIVLRFPLPAGASPLTLSSPLLPVAAATVWTQRAAYAKGKGKGKGGGDEKPEVSASELMAQTKDSLSSKMKGSVDWLAGEFAKIRLGRANTELLDKIKVEGTPLAKKGSVFVKDSFTLAVTPFEKEQTKKIIEALRNSNMDFNPQSDGDHILVRLPKATDEYRHSLLKQAGKLSEEVKNSIRRARQAALADLKKYKDSISKDDMKKLENEVQKITDENNKKVDQMHKAKEQAITAGSG